MTPGTIRRIFFMVTPEQAVKFIYQKLIPLLLGKKKRTAPKNYFSLKTKAGTQGNRRNQGVEIKTSARRQIEMEQV